MKTCTEPDSDIVRCYLCGYFAYKDDCTRDTAGNWHCWICNDKLLDCEGDDDE